MSNPSVFLFLSWIWFLIFLSDLFSDIPWKQKSEFRYLPDMWVDVIDLQFRFVVLWVLQPIVVPFIHHCIVQHDLSCLVVDKYLLIERESRFDLWCSEAYPYGSIHQKNLSICFFSKQAKWEMIQCHLSLFLLVNSLVWISEYCRPASTYQKGKHIYSIDLSSVFLLCSISIQYPVFPWSSCILSSDRKVFLSFPFST